MEHTKDFKTERVNHVMGILNCSNSGVNRLNRFQNNQLQPNFLKDNMLAGYFLHDILG